MSNALALIQADEYKLITALAKIAADSGYSGKNEKQAAFIMIKGYELGISPMQALDGIQVIQGKTTVSPQLMLALINRSGELDDMNIDSSAVVCTVTMKRRGRSPHTEVFSMENAKSMGLAGKDNWNKQPATMLKWRAVAACARVVFPDVIQGMYTPEEMGAVVIENAAGDIQIIEGERAIAPVPPAIEGKISEDTGEITIEDAPVSENPLPAGMSIDQIIASANSFYKSPPQERYHTAKKMQGEGAFADCKTVDDAALLLAERVKSHHEQEAESQGLPI